jgi:hypothetical protein
MRHAIMRHAAMAQDLGVGICSLLLKPTRAATTSICEHTTNMRSKIGALSKTLHQQNVSQIVARIVTFPEKGEIYYLEALFVELFKK